jgi:type I restriction enzyme S subunit
VSTEDAKPNVPKGWECASAEELCEKIQDGTHFSPKAQFDEGAFPYVTAKNVRSLGLDLSSLTYLREEEHRKIYQRCDCRRGDVLLVKDGVNTGDVAVNTLDGEISLLSSVCMLRPRASLLSPGFLRYYLQSPQGNRLLTGRMTGTAIRRIILRRIKQTPVVVCSLGCQYRIVDAIDSYLTRLDAAVASLERVQAKLRAYRASVLKAAVEGRLVPTEASLARAEKRAYEPAEVLLARILKERRRRSEDTELAKLKAKGRAPKGDTWKAKYEEPVAPDTAALPQLPEGWCWASVDQLGLVSGGLTQNVSRETHETKLPFLRVANVHANALVLDEIKVIGVEPGEIERARLLTGDLLVVEGNGSVDQIGRVALWDGSIEPILHQNHLIKVRCEPRQLSKWALAWLLSPAGRVAIERVASSTSGLHTLSISKVGRLVVPLPPLAEQIRVSDDVDAKLSVADAADESVARDLRRCSRLRQAVLKWAFEGKLVDQDPTDEPAEKLLARIGAERAVVAPAKKSHSRAAKGAA